MFENFSLEQSLLKAKSYANKGDIAEAQKLYETILKNLSYNIKSQQELTTLNKFKQNDPSQSLLQEVVNQLVNLYNQGQFVVVAERAEILTKQYPDEYVAWNLLGAANISLEQFEKASEALKKLTELNPNYAIGFNNLGIALKNQGKLIDAVKTFKKALLIKSNYPEAYNNMGNALQDQGKSDEAIDAFKKSISLKPDYAQAYYNMGVTLKEQGRLDEAVDAFKKSIAIKPDSHQSYNNMGNIFQNQGKLDKALNAYKNALLIKPDYSEAHCNSSFIYNLKGDLQKGLELYEWRLKNKNAKARLPREHLIWDGIKPIIGKRFFVYEEQGLGDMIQFCRYLLLLKQKGAEVTLRAQPKMHALLQTMDSNIVLVDNDPDDINIDFEAPLMSLPYLFNTNLDTIPSSKSYLFANHDKVISWGKRFTKPTFKIGICWQGATLQSAVGKSFPLSLFEDISKLPNVELISLHKGEGEKQIKNINFDLTTLGSDFDTGGNSFIDTAAVMINCDLIISCDTSTTHLAGALGCLTWVVLQKIPEWRWMLDRTDSPWYPNMTLYRQEEFGDWKYVFEIMKKDLAKLIKQGRKIK